MRKQPMRGLRAFCGTVAVCVAVLNVRAYSAPARAVVAYVFPQDNALQPGDIDASRLTRINYAFANIVDGRMVTGLAKDPENYAFLESLKKENPSLTVLASVGGWLWST